MLHGDRLSCQNLYMIHGRSAQTKLSCSTGGSSYNNSRRPKASSRANPST